MFGKRSMSAADQFVMSEGKRVGNLKGRGSKPKSAPMAPIPTTKTPRILPKARAGLVSGKAKPVKV